MQKSKELEESSSRLYTKMKEDIQEKVSFPEGVEVKVAEGIVHVKGRKGELSRRMVHPKIRLEVKGSELLFSAKKATKREKRMIGTFKAHVKNMMRGVCEEHVYKLKVCSGHFPMNVSVSGNEFVVKNFMGETIPRKIQLKPGVEVKVEGNDVTIKSINKELAGQTALVIEKLTKRPGFDNRIFQDGIYIYIKDGRELK